MASFAIIGFGEVGSIFARDLHATGHAGARVNVYDVSNVARERAGSIDYVNIRDTAAGAASNAEVVIVAVTAGSALAAASQLRGGLSQAPFVLDVNSVSPSTKQDAAWIIGEAGGRYVEAAVMTSVPPRGLRSPMLLGGPHAKDFMAAMVPFGMTLTAFSDEVGKASSVKMCRSVMIKGLEALTLECMLAARFWGVEHDVLRTLSDTLPNDDWPRFAHYVMSRALFHGKRRAEEMREVAKTVAACGLEPLLSQAIAERQDWAGRQGTVIGRNGLAAPDLDGLLDSLMRAGLNRPVADHEGPLEKSADAS